MGKNKEIVEREIRITSASGKQMSIKLSEPGEGKKHLVIFCHGFMSSKESRTNIGLTENLLQNQIATCRFDFYGHGEDGHPFQEITLSRCLQQLEAVLGWAKENNYSKVGLLGSSFGGLVAIHAAAGHPEITALGLKCPVSNYPPIWRDRLGDGGMAHWKESGSLSFMAPEGRARLDYRFFEDLLNYDTYEEAAKITTPTLIIHGDADDDVPFSQSDHLHKILRSQNELIVIGDADHTFSKHEDFEQMLHLLAEWFIRKINGALV